MTFAWGGVREDINTFKTFTELAKKKLPRTRATWSSFSRGQKRHFARMTYVNGNNRCHDNYDGNYGHFDDNIDKTYRKIFKYC